MTQYYSPDLTRASWPEIWRHAPNIPLFTVAAILRLTGTRTVPRFGVARDGLRFIESDAVPDDAAIRLRSITDACAPLGFRPCLWSTVAAIGPVDAYNAMMIGDAGTVYAGAVWVRTAIHKPSHEELVFCAFSRLTENGLVSTTNGKRRMDPPRGFQVLHLPGQDVRSVLNRHHERLSVIPQENIVRLDEVLLRETVWEASQRVQDFQIERGVWRLLSEDQVAAIIKTESETGANSVADVKAS